MGWETIAAIAAVAGAGTGIYSATKRPNVPKSSPPPVPVEGGDEPEARKVKKYRSAAQMFRDEDLRLGAGGKLGM